MKQQPFSFFYRFTRGQRKGVVALFLIVLVFQGICFFVASFDFSSRENKSRKEKEWLSMQGQIDALKADNVEVEKIFPFNPNFISDYKGYQLGMSLTEIDRLHAYRAKGKFLNSAEDFQEVTKVPDSLFKKISPYFKFPEYKNKKVSGRIAAEDKILPQYKSETVLAKIDINKATEEDLVKVRGIGVGYAQMILRRKTALGGFVSMEQLSDFKELSTEVLQLLSQTFEIRDLPSVNSINVNTASLNQLSHFPYFTKNIARAILTRRSMKGKIESFEELLEINDFPVEKKKIIALYLEF